ncbi:hypothetical protein HWQ46_21710 [Shewanella sp. D64]|uniref:hypothetical protein n=1 Tax=unclassified Shewanella TaxID=196818 RepID=UPI0022BA3708|nr:MULTISPECIES: hypothetical protein [unclassified Shewanella]MEC4728157.1 hypothetical protein [Shewanella sp. D64]MEC4740277.1 hypothetical protein [Shewanella sp. E94]WBJ94407.1 hypothetical protein HWQ47_21445 [Shewanella sp. MTB7]
MLYLKSYRMSLVCIFFVSNFAFSANADEDTPCSSANNAVGLTIGITVAMDIITKNIMMDIQTGKLREKLAKAQDILTNGASTDGLVSGLDPDVRAEVNKLNNDLNSRCFQSS